MQRHRHLSTILPEKSFVHPPHRISIIRISSIVSLILGCHSFHESSSFSRYSNRSPFLDRKEFSSIRRCRQRRRTHLFQPIDKDRIFSSSHLYRRKYSKPYTSLDAAIDDDADFQSFMDEEDDRFDIIQVHGDEKTPISALLPDDEPVPPSDDDATPPPSTIPSTEPRLPALLTEPKWSNRIIQLRQFCVDNGHCRVPYNHPHENLGVWAIRIRKMKRDSVIPSNKLDLLNEMRFDWNDSHGRSSPEGPFKPHLWKARVGDLVEFGEEWGHLDVPRVYGRNQALGNWAWTQRYQYKKFKMGFTGQMSEGRIEELEGLGFNFISPRERRKRQENDIPSDNSVNNESYRISSIDDEWTVRLKELRQFKKEHGDCIVPLSYTSNPKLGHWVYEIRRQHKLLHEGNDNNPTSEPIHPLETITPTLTDKQIDTLHKLQFEWHVDNVAMARRSFQVLFEERMNELKDHMNENGGSCDVPFYYDKHPLLPQWVREQRCHYKLWEKGKECALTESRVQALLTLGFSFEQS